MGKRDFRRREPKKPRKGAKKPSGASVLTAPGGVEVIKKGKKAKEIGEE